jgi:uncharacterized protein
MRFQTELTEAIDEGAIGRVRDLLAAGCDPNGFDAFGESPLAVAAMRNELEVLKLLLQYGADIRLANVEGWTALHFAVDHAIDSAIQGGDRPGEECVASIDWLMQNGADASAKSADGSSPIDIARTYRSDRVLNTLEGSTFKDD